MMEAERNRRMGKGESNAVVIVLVVLKLVRLNAKVNHPSEEDVRRNGSHNERDELVPPTAYTHDSSHNHVGMGWEDEKGQAHRRKLASLSDMFALSASRLLDVKAPSFSGDGGGGCGKSNENMSASADLAYSSKCLCDSSSVRKSDWPCIIHHTNPALCTRRKEGGKE